MSKPEKKQKTNRPFDFSRFWGIWNLVEAFIILAAGVLAITYGILYFGQSSDKQNTTDIVKNILPFMVGAFIAMDAILRVLMVIFNKKEKPDESIMLIGGFELTAAIVIMIMHSDFTDLLIYSVAVLLIVIGALLILFSVLSIGKSKKKLFVPILEIVFAAILIAIGVAILIIYATNHNEGIVLLVAGIVFIVASIAQAAITGINMHKHKKEEKAKNKAKEDKADPTLISNNPINDEKALEITQKDDSKDDKNEPEVIEAEPVDPKN